MNKLTRQILRTLAAVGGVAILIYMGWVVRFTLIYVLISAVIAVIGKPMVDLFTGVYWDKIHLSRTVAAAITLVLIIGVFSGILSIFIPSLMEELTVLSKLDFEQIYLDLHAEFYKLRSFFLPEAPPQNPDDALLRPGLTDVLSIDSISDTFAGLLGSLGNLVFALFSVIFITFFFLREKHLFRNIVLAILPDRLEEKVFKVAPIMRNTLGRYFAGLILQITIITTVVSIGLSIFGFSNTIVIGFFAGLINVIPYLGPIIGMSFGLILGLAQTVSENPNAELLPAAGAIVGVFALTQLVDNFVLQPIIFSRSIKAHPLEIFLVISFAAAWAGISGMIVAVPVYSVVRLIAAEFFPQVKVVRALIKNPGNGTGAG